MLVFGDRSERAGPRERLAEIGERLDAVATIPPGIARHAALASALIDAGSLHQAIADAAFEKEGCDRAPPAAEGVGRWVFALAQLLHRSWDSSFATFGTLPRAPDPKGLPDEVQVKTPEGFAFYAVYPEAYLEAARRLRLVRPPRVIGIRSIGTTLGAVVAAALNAEPPITLRPFGDPFARRIAVDASLEARLLDGERHYVIVDEGPGQSGSSFGAVADWLQDRGVPLERIAFLPSHSGALVSQASAAHRARWQAAQRETADFGDRLPELAATWLRDLLGPLDGDLREISGGEWRRLKFGSEAEWPAAIAMFERRKFLAGAGGEHFLVKFAGLGRVGEEKLRIARRLHAGDLVPEPIGLVHGFLVERWHEAAAPLAAGERPVEAMAQYLGARARLLPAAEEDGASIGELYEMIRRNVSLALGEEAAEGLRCWEPRLTALQSRVARVRTDNCLDRHEWLRAPGGRLLKTDALDHHQAHDLIGCQDLAWDVAGAIAEFDLDAASAELLIARTEEEAGGSIERELLDFYRIAYAAFRLGLASIGADLASGDPAEKTRAAAAVERYRTQLSHLLLDGSTTATRRACSVNGEPERTGPGTNVPHSRFKKKMHAQAAES